MLAFLFIDFLLLMSVFLYLIICIVYIPMIIIINDSSEPTWSKGHRGL